jgi:DNA-binding transcriptional regulator YiaG
MRSDGFLDDVQLRNKILEHIKSGKYRLSKHAAEEQAQDGIDLQDTLHVLKTGRHEKAKTLFDNKHQNWKYAISRRNRRFNKSKSDHHIFKRIDDGDSNWVVVMERKKETFIYEGLGFPLELIDTPMKKVFGEWIIDIDMNQLQKFVFKGLIHKPYPLTGKEMRFMRKFLELSTTELGASLGVSHATVVKWEKEQAKVSPIQETYIRMFLFERLNDNEILNLYKEIKPKMLAEAKDEKYPPFSVDTKQLQLAV